MKKLLHKLNQTVETLCLLLEFDGNPGHGGMGPWRWMAGWLDGWLAACWRLAG